MACRVWAFKHEFQPELGEGDSAKRPAALDLGPDVLPELGKRVALPCGLQSLTFCSIFYQSWEEVARPNGLRNLTFGLIFNRSMEEVAVPRDLQRLAFGIIVSCCLLRSGVCGSFESIFNRSLEKVALPSGLRNLSFGRLFNQSFKKVALPSGLKSLNQSLEKVALLRNLLAGCSTRALRRCLSSMPVQRAACRRSPCGCGR